MTYMNNIGEEAINRRKTISDFKGETDALTTSDNRLRSQHGTTYKEIRDTEDKLEIKHIENTDVESEAYYDDLLGKH